MIAGLLDTHPLLWALADDERLAASLRNDIERDASRFGHRDPFGRLLVAQARDLGVALVTADVALSAYDVAILW